MTLSEQFQFNLDALTVGSSEFEIFGASVVGESHQRRSLPCQDFFINAIGSNWAVCVVSDGAGSAIRCFEGATFVSEDVCEALTSELKKDHSGSDNQSSMLDWVKEAVVNGIEKARERCIEGAQEGETIATFHATVVGCVLLNESGVFFQIGDGGASAFRVLDGEVQTLGFSEPENGEYANQTFFFTERHWRDHLRVSEIAGRAEEVWLMTDGAYDLMVPYKQKELRDLAVREVSRLVSECKIEERSKTLATILSSRQAMNRSDDDKTLVIMKRK